MCLIDDADGMVLHFDSGVRKARQTHVCGECRRTIVRGEKYHFYTGKWEGEVVTYKWCLHCQVGVDWLNANCSGWVFGRVLEDLQEHIAGCGPGHVGADMLLYVQAMEYRFGGGEMPVPTALENIP